MKKLIIRMVTVLVILLVVALAVVFFSLNSIVKKAVQTLGPEMTKVEVKLGSADISPLSGSGRLTKLFVGNPEGYTTPSSIQAGDIKVAVKIGSVFKDTVVVNELNIQAPEITFEGSISGNNLSKILDNITGTDQKKKSEPAPAGQKKEKKICVKELVIDGGKINLNVGIKGVVANQSLTVPLPPIHLQNIGTEDLGVTAAELAKQIMEPVLASATKAAADALGSAGKQLENLGKGVPDSLNKATKGVTDLFKKN